MKIRLYFMKKKNFSIDFYYIVKYSINMKREFFNLNIMNYNFDNFRIIKW